MDGRQSTVDAVDEMSDGDAVPDMQHATAAGQRDVHSIQDHMQQKMQKELRRMHGAELDQKAADAAAGEAGSMHVNPRFIASLLSFCDKCSIDIVGNVTDAVKIIIVLSMKFIDKRALMGCAVPGGYVDWDFVDMNLGATAVPASAKGSGNPIGDVTLWMQLMKFLDFGVFDMNEMLFKKAHPPLWCIFSTLRQTGVLVVENSKHSTEPRPNTLRFDDACKLCLLNNVLGLQSRAATEHYTCARLGRNSFSVCTNVLSALADERHAADVYLSTMKYMLSIVKVRSDVLFMHIQHYKQSQEVRRHTWRLKHMAVQHTRPSMREVANRVSNRSDAGSLYGLEVGGMSYTQSDVSDTSSMAGGSIMVPAVGASAITFEHFCDAVRFPNSMSRLLRVRCYLLCCLEHAFDYRQHTDKLVTRDVAAALNRNNIVIPDVGSVGAGIDTLVMHGQPFKELDIFRQRCFVSFAVRNRRNLTMTMALQLYVAAYQRKEIWKQCWKNVYPVMSSQISKDVETYVDATPIAADSLVYILKNSTPFY